jgi:hypothetical protein
MELPSEVAHVQKIIMNASFLYEGTLTVGDELAHN